MKTYSFFIIILLFAVNVLGNNPENKPQLHRDGMVVIDDDCQTGEIFFTCYRESWPEIKKCIEDFIVKNDENALFFIYKKRDNAYVTYLIQKTQSYGWRVTTLIDESLGDLNRCVKLLPIQQFESYEEWKNKKEKEYK